MSENFDEKTFQNKAAGFDKPVQLPASDADASRWQGANKAWWEKTPMRYDWRDPIGSPPGTKPYYDEIDRRFLEATRQYMPWKSHPFEQLIPYSKLPGLDVLEIGVGHGTHAQLLATHAKSFTGVDLTNAARESTSRRFELAGLSGRILQMDAESMSFPDASFDFVWSWGVIHHSANTQQVLREIARVLRPGGSATVMVYYRSFLQYYVINGLARGILRGEFWTLGSIHKINQGATDGAIARFFTSRDFAKLLPPSLVLEKAWVTGQKADALPLPSGRVKTFLLAHAPNALTRFITDRLRVGTFLVLTLRRT